MTKFILQIMYSCSVQKTARKKTKCSKNETILKISLHANAHAKSSFWVKNPHFGSKIKILKNMSQFILQIIYNCSVQKTATKKDQIFEKWDHFKNRPSCKGYSPCKIRTLGQKLKFKEICQDPFYKSIYNCSVQKIARKKTKYSRNETILKIGHHAKAIAHAK